MMSNDADTTIHEIFMHYRELASYCDVFFQHVLTSLGHHIFCKPGCAQCCTLETVNVLETAMLRAELLRTGKTVSAASSPSAYRRSVCPLLMNGRCTLFRSRPLICRTEGLAILMRDDDRMVLNHCELNFQQFPIGRLPSEYILDGEKITMNLARLNLAFCRVLGDEPLADGRIRLRRIADGTLPPAVEKAAHILLSIGE